MSQKPVRAIADTWNLSKSAISRHKKHIKDIMLLNSDLPEIPVVVPVPEVPEETKPVPVMIVTDVKSVEYSDLQRGFKILFDHVMELIDETRKAKKFQARIAALNRLQSTLDFILKAYGLTTSEGTNPGLIQLQDKYDKMNDFLMHELCDECRTKIVQTLT